MADASIHRYRDKVAIYLGEGKTIYLTVRDAEFIAQALDDCATDIRNVNFTNSEFTTRSTKLD